jgi:hypothetical protein
VAAARGILLSMDGIITSTHVTTIIWLTFIVIVLRSTSDVVLGVVDIFARLRLAQDTASARNYDDDGDLIDEDPDDLDDARDRVNGHEHSQA